MNILRRGVSFCSLIAVFLLAAFPAAASAQTSSISGTITDSVGTPLTGVEVTAYTAGNAWVSGTVTDPSGNYTINGLTDATTYFVATRNQQGFIDETWNNIQCLGCDVSANGVGIPTTGAVVNINFALDQGARFSGTVIGGGNPVSGASISLYNTAGQYAGYGYTAADGTFTTTAVPAGSYRFHTFSLSGFIDQAYGGITCTSCSPTTGTQVPAGAPGSITGGIDFALVAGKQFSGRITDMLGNGLAHASVSMYDASGNYAGGGFADVDGYYLTQAVLPGSYRIRSYNNLGYVNEVFDNFQCVSCSTTAGPQTATGAGAITPNIDFALAIGGAIRTTITTAGGAPLAGVYATVFDAAGTGLYAAITGATGIVKLDGLPVGTYYVRTNNSIGYLDEIYDNVDCPACNVLTSGAPIGVVQGADTNISIALAPGARMTGVVTGVGGVPLPNVNITVYTPAGQIAGGGFTAADGSYTTTALVAGSYLIRTSPVSGYVAQAYDGINCMSCPPTTGTLITLAASELRSGINFALAQSGTIQGTVTGAGGAPLSNVSVFIYDAFGAWAGAAQTLPNGTYSAPDLLPGTYYLRTSNSLGYLDQLHSGISCASGCIATNGTPITIAAGGSSTVNFALTLAGRITGTITGTGGLPLQNVTVQIYNSAGAHVTSVATDVNGVYTSSALATGNYFARTFNSQGYLDRLHNGISCSPNCTITAGTSIAVAAGANTTINFALTLGATITGTISSSAGGAAQGVSFLVYSSTGTFVTQTGPSNASGNFTSNALAPGNYYLRTSNSAGFVDRLYNTATVCFPFCTVTTGTLTALAGGSNTINMTLDPGGRIAGRVTDNVTGLGISGVSVSAALAPGNTTGTLGTTDANGNFASSFNLPTGTFWVRTSNGLGYMDELHNNIACAPSCVLSTGTGVSVSQGSTTTVDFGLDKGVRFTGTVTGPTVASVQVINAAGTTLLSTAINGSGVYTTSTLAPGTYFLRTTNTQGFVDQLYNGLVCVPACTPTSGTPVTPAAGTTQTVNFTLQAGGSITGNVSGPAGGVGGVIVEVYVQTGPGSTSAVRQATTSSVAGSVGNFSITGVAPATYYIRTRNTQGLQDEVFTSPDTNSLCINCGILTVPSTPVVVSYGSASTVNFNLTQGGFITGRVTDASTGNGVANATVSLSGLTVATSSTAVTDATGNYKTTGLPTGQYVIRYNASTANNFVGQIYAGITCAGCANSEGTPINVMLGSGTPNIDMALTRGGHISGIATDASTGATLTSITVDIINSSGTTVTSASTNLSGTYTSIAIPAGTYFLRTRMNNSSGPQGYINEAFNDITCVGCNPTLGTPVTVNVDVTTANISFALTKGSRVSGAVTDGAAPLASQSVSLFNAAGVSVASAGTDAAGTFRFLEGFPAGTYYSAGGGSNGFFRQVYGGSNCITSCVATSGTPIVVTSGSDITGVNFSLTVGGRISGTVTEAGTGAAIPGVSVVIHNSDGVAVASGGVTSGGTFVTGALPTGTYRAITTNGLGFINQSYGGGDYLGTDLATTGTAIDVTVGATTTDVNFSLSRGARIAGTVTGAGGSPLKNVLVEFWTAPFTRRVGTATTNVLGQYTSSAGLPAGNYTVVTTNNFGYVNEIWNGAIATNIACVLDCSPGSGTAVAVAGTATTSGIDFALDLDADTDTDGINNTIDKNLGSGADEQNVSSNDFSDVQIGGRTAGTIADRGGFSVAVLDLSSAGVQATATGAGTSDVRLTVCAVGAAEEVRLRSANDSAVITCALTTGSANVFALVAATKVELRKTIGGITTIVEIGQGQGATLGSPAAADEGNTESIFVRIINAATGEELGSYTLDPGESAEATADAQGNVTIDVVSGAVTATVRGETVTIGEGQSQTFDAPPPPPSTSGRMHGEGKLKTGADEFHFKFHVSLGISGGGNNAFSVDVTRNKNKDRFAAASFSSIAFTGNAVVFSGTGTWNGTAGHTFEVSTADLGEPGKGAESITIVIKNGLGQVVASVSGVLTNGNIQKVK